MNIYNDDLDSLRRDPVLSNVWLREGMGMQNKYKLNDCESSYNGVQKSCV